MTEIAGRSPLRLATRSFLLAALPILIACVGGLAALRGVIENRVRSGLKETLIRRESELERALADHRQRRKKVLARLTANESLTGALQGLREGGDSAAAASPILAELGQAAHLGDHDLLLASDWLGRGVAGLVLRDRVETLSSASRYSVADVALLDVEGDLFELTTVPVEQGGERAGFLSTGRRFNIEAANPGGHAILTRFGKIVRSSFRHRENAALEGRLFLDCPGARRECEIQWGGQSYVVLSAKAGMFGGDYRLLLLESPQSAAERLLIGFWPILAGVGLCAVILGLLAARVGSRTVARPLARLIGRLEECGQTGQWRRDFIAGSTTREVNELADALNRASESIQNSQRQFNRSFLYFLESMIEAIDARVPCSAGHSQRVSEYAAATAKAMELPDEQIEIVRIGAQLHDLGKAGIPDSFLQRPERLTAEEEERVRQHPRIGRKILDRIGRFGPYLPIVEFHHEDYDGGGYPDGLRGHQIPLGARIVRVADAYDELSSEQPHRRAMPPERAIQILIGCAGKQFDPEVVDVFLSILPAPERPDAGQRQPILC